MTNDVVHVVPEHDTHKHLLSEVVACDCHPIVLIDSVGGFCVVHNAFNGAELDAKILESLDGFQIASEPHRFRMDFAISNRIL